MNFNAFHKISYGLYLVTTQNQGKKFGYVANTVFQVSAEPALLAISCHKDNLSTNAIHAANAFAVSVLKQEANMKIIGDFGFKSSNEFNKFDGINIHTSKSGLPVVLDGTMAWFDCKVVNSIDLGTHYLIIGQVVEAELIKDEDPLTYQIYREKYKMFSPKNSPTFLDQNLLSDSNQPQVEPITIPEHEHLFDGKSYICVICGFVYDPEEGDPSMGIPPRTPFDELPDSYKCPICNAGKDYFKEV